MYRDLRSVAVENKKIVLQNYYVKDGKKVEFTHSLADHQKVIVVSPSDISSAVLSSPLHDSVCKISVINDDSFAVPCDVVMNFANAYHPGGGYLSGARAQEETLCRESTLYASISSSSARVMYDANIHSSSVFNTDYMLLSPCVEVFRDGGNHLLSSPRTTAVLTLAAPNLLYNPKVHGITMSELDDYMVKRLYQFFLICSLHGYRTICTGAWGCGAFGHDAMRVASYFHTVIYQMGMGKYFDTILFAVKTGRDPYNYEAFKRVFE
ncbi:MAG: TIGR02452 family protein [Lactimicrobium sp.]|jgi:uncharacterized protein (TIGR02452 family)|uniref:TIGR02452 family protein n=1 Tax=Lactimicrobium sp. TaxID=2563780 RepID=UPI002F357FA2